MPPELHSYPHAAEVWTRAVSEAKDAYGEILRVLKEARKESGTVGDQREVRRAVRSAARSVLPNCTETTILITVNARALRHFFALRGAIPGDREMRELTVEMLKAVKKEAPSLFFDFEVARFENGSPMVRKVAHEAKEAK
jgi:thymidylate synthase (FAD)